MLNKQEYYKLAGKLESGGDATPEEVMDLYVLTIELLELIEGVQDEEPDIFGTEGYEHAIGWD